MWLKAREQLEERVSGANSVFFQGDQSGVCRAEWDETGKRSRLDALYDT